MGTRKRQILVVDDVELNRAILAELFQDSYEVLEAENGRQALELLEARHEDILIVLLDIIMPVMDGFEMLQNMARREWKEEIPVVLITSENSDNALLRGYELGVSDIINKPFNPNIVKRRVDNTIELYLHKRHLEALVRQQVETLEKQALKLNRFNEFIIDTLSTVVEFRSCESGTHIKRVREITRLLLESLSFRYPEYALPRGSIDKIVSAASMHDIGKIAIPDAVLNKPGRLTAEEFEIMKTHSLKGCELLQSINEGQDEEYYRFCYDICRSHHERWDGSGYPDGLAGNNIPIWAQVVSLADVYDALTSERVYKGAYTHAQAVSMILNGECGVFNPRLLNSFLSVASRLENGEVGPTLRERVSVPAKPSRRDSSLSARTLWLLEREREKYRVLSELSGDIVFNYDVKRDMLECSEKWYEVFGRDITVPNVRRTLLRSSFIHEDDRPDVLRRLSGTTPKQPRCRMEIRLMTSGGGYEWFDIYVNALWDADSGSRIGYLGKLTNINERKTEVNLWREQANTDPLTGLSNRKRMEEQITQALEEDRERGAAFLFIDVDDFKIVNDTLGHLFGDEVLRYVASAIRHKVRTTDIVGRVGGDEFVVLLRNVRSIDVISKKSEEICTAFRAKYSEATPHGGVSCSVGIALYPGDGECYEDLMDKADQALYAAKKKGKNCFAFYDVTFCNKAFPSVLSEVESGI
ncbi:diguanylate cyclase domain-containing protein [uncultured Bilophila sp.]|uniref:diguanylate cyclase domain-containing protein n=1 Tax=uncultured Bilophila sp. TaxID=529385 RepID=UPI00280AA4C9|nr:diguanylate cyclase [uncultured Bilophila sp.]